MNRKLMHVCGIHFSALILLSLFSSAQAADYVPPPSGPYQSSVVIKSRGTGEDAARVYKFPPADLFVPTPTDKKAETRPQTSVQLNRADRQDVSRRGRDDVALQRPPAGYKQTTRPPATQAWQQQAVPPTAGNNMNQPSPWAMSPPQTSQGYGYPGQWQQQQKSGAYAYPYGYGYDRYNQSEYMPWGNNFGTMPSPWNMMRDNPFFSNK